MNNDARFSALKQRVGGNREVTGYEMTFGMPRETQWHITPPNKHQRRIISELEFALKLDDVNNGKYSEYISSALDVVASSLESEGVLTATACAEAEKRLMPLAAAAKEYSLILCAHAHIDMNWMWGWNETVAAALATFKTMLDLMDEYPTFTYSQSQTSVYRLVEEYDPDLMERIKARIAEGRWEITSSAWVETDKNMPTGESLVNTIKYTRDYLERVWGVDPESLKIDFSPDTFGHSANIPEIDSYGGLKYYYHCRGLNGDYILYRYKALSGAEILMYREPYWYNSAITPHIGAGLIDLVRRMGGLKTGLIVYGVGNHGGGATRRDVERALEMSEWPIYPNIRFGTFREFFELADKPEIREKLPVVDKELNYLFDGCYTTQSRIKRANRMAESGLIESQSVATLANEYVGGRYNFKAYETAWQNVLFTHFHDILTGSCVQDSREYAMGLYQVALAHSATEENLSLRALSDNIDCTAFNNDGECEIIRESQSEGAGVGYGISNFTGVPNPERGVGLTRVYNIFNPTQVERTDLCELTVWDWVGDLRRLTVVDVDGNQVEFALVDGGYQHYWDHKYVRVLVRVKLPAYGYKTIAIKQNEVEKYPYYYGGTHNILGYEDAYVLENEYIRAEFDKLSMSLISLVDKTDGSEKINSKEFAGLVQINTQTEGNSAWVIGKYHDVNPVDNISRVDRFGFGGLKTGYRFEARVLNSTVRCEISLAAGAKSLTYSVSVDWNELAGRFVPMLALRMPVGYTAEKYLCDIPMGSILRDGGNHDFPALTYSAAIASDGAGDPLYVMTDSKYGYQLFDNTITATLINTAHNPDPDPERGHHEIVVSVGVGSNCAKCMADISDRFMHPLRFVSTNPHAGKLPSDGILAEVDTQSAHITSITKLESGKLLVRVNELCGKTAKVSLGFRSPVVSAELVDLLGNKLGDALDKDKAVFEVKPYSIMAVEIALG